MDPFREAKLRAFRAAQEAMDDNDPDAREKLIDAVMALEDTERCASCGARITDFVDDAMVAVQRGAPSKLLHSVCFFDEFEGNVWTREMGVVN